MLGCGCVYEVRKCKAVVGFRDVAILEAVLGSVHRAVAVFVAAVTFVCSGSGM